MSKATGLDELGGYGSMGTSPRGVIRRALLILSVLLVGCSSSPVPAQATAAGTIAPSTILASSNSPEGPPKASASCTSRQRVPPKGQFSDVRGWIVYRCGSRIVAVDPTHPHQPLSLGPSHGADPIGWSPDGTRLLLRMETADVGWDLFVLDAGGTRALLTTHKACCWVPRGGFWGSFSPDGNRVVYGSVDIGPWVVDADGGKSRYRGPAGDVGAFTYGCCDESAAWSPDGSSIAFLDSHEGIRKVSVVSPDGTGLRKLVPLHLAHWYGAGGIAWSPDGSRLALSMSGDHDAPSRIYVVDADGSGLQRIPREGDNAWPAWSPDGSRIAFVRGHRLFTMAPDGSDVRRVKGVEPDGPIAWNPIR